MKSEKKIGIRTENCRIAVCGAQVDENGDVGRGIGQCQERGERRWKEGPAGREVHVRYCRRVKQVEDVRGDLYRDSSGDGGSETGVGSRENGAREIV